MNKRFSILITLFAAIILLHACRKDPQVEEPFSVPMPEYFGKPVFDVSRFPITKERFELGRKLFFDPILSRDNTISCGSCHIQSSAFTQHGHDVSHGIDDLLGRRNAPAVQNMLWMKQFFWDGGVHNLELVSINAITSPVEMDESPARVLEKLQTHPEYPTLFKKAYGNEEISSENFLFALAHYMGGLVSNNSHYDKVMRKETSFNDLQLKGKQVFDSKCATCHSGHLFTNQEFSNNGRYASFPNDKGLYEITLNPADEGKFKIPSLRNVEITGPYMHDGRVRTLSQAIDHYRNGVQDSPTLDPKLKVSGRLGIEISDEEKEHLMEFLKTLTDWDFVRNPKLGE
jgi:cytochrome c peroxidase